MLKNLKEIFNPYRKFIIVLPFVILIIAIVAWGCDKNDLPKCLFDSKNVVDIHLQETLDNSREGFEEQYDYLKRPSEEKIEESVSN